MSDLDSTTVVPSFLPDTESAPGENPRLVDGSARAGVCWSTSASWPRSWSFSVSSP